MTDVDRDPELVVSFTAMEHGTEADYRLLDKFECEHAAALADRVLGTLDRLSGSLGGYKITRLEHSLRSATRARLDGADVDWIVAALVHDIGGELAPYNHAAIAAAVLAPYVREEVAWVVDHHGLFQTWYFAHHLGGDRHGRQRFVDHRWYGLCEQFCARWDQTSFDPDFPIHDLDSFADEVLAVFSRPAWDAARVAYGPSVLVP